jgi:hypothetical protein
MNGRELMGRERGAEVRAGPLSDDADADDRHHTEGSRD